MSKTNMSKNELERTFKKTMEINNQLKDKLDNWINAFIDIGARYHIVNPDDPYFKDLPESTMREILHQEEAIRDEQRKDTPEGGTVEP